MDFLKGLNAQQREAVSHIDGPLLILAGAGSGKTRVITHRIAHIITTRHVPPSSVLAVTFTNKAAREMRERVDALLEDVPLDSAPNLSTFHSFCVRMLRRDGDPLARVRPGFTRRFSIYDDEDQLVIIKAAYRTLGLDEKEFMQYRAALSQDQPRQEHQDDAAGFLQERGQQRVRRPSPRSSSNTRRRCATPTRWISTICCWKRSACCSTTTPLARLTTAG